MPSNSTLVCSPSPPLHQNGVTRFVELVAQPLPCPECNRGMAVRFSHLVRAGIMPQSAYLGKQFLIHTLCSAARHPAHHCCSRGRNLSRPGRETAGFLRPRHGSLRPPPPSFRTEQADAFSSQLAPARRWASAERNLSSLRSIPPLARPSPHPPSFTPGVNPDLSRLVGTTSAGVPREPLRRRFCGTSRPFGGTFRVCVATLISQGVAALAAI